MSTRTIASPGIEINEIDLSLGARSLVGTNVFVTGFAPQGPTEEIVTIASISEFETLFGTPTNAQERYFYYTVKQVLSQSNATVNVCRLPYGAGQGDGIGNQYTALVFPVSSGTLSGPSSALEWQETSSYEDANCYTIQSPSLVNLTEDQYNLLSNGSVSWLSAGTFGSFASFEEIAGAGLVILNPTKLTVNDFYEGSYIVLSDNSNINPAQPHMKVQSLEAFNGEGFETIPSSRLNFKLTEPLSGVSSGSVSEIVEKLPFYNFGSNAFNDCVNVSRFKLFTSKYAQDTLLLNQRLMEYYTGSLYFNRTQNDPNGGLPKTLSLETVVNKSSQDVKVVINPHISNSNGWVDAGGKILKRVRIEDSTKKLVSMGNFVRKSNSLKQENLGNIPYKLDRVLSRVDNLDLDLDIIPEAGLGTLWGQSEISENAGLVDSYFNEAYSIDTSGIKIQEEDEANSDLFVQRYKQIVNQFTTFAEFQRKDHMFIADPLRCVFVDGNDLKTTKKSNYNFSVDIYWPLKNLYGSLPTSYAATYGNWVKVGDDYSSKQVWVPSSGFVAADFADSAAKNFPWSAVAGFNRGVLRNVLDIAVNPTQKQRDLLYRINVNPIAYFQGDGYVIYGQKTLFNKPSAFDRINVRRLFLHLEKTTKQLLKYYLFEPNTFSTRNRLIDALFPVFQRAKQNDGVYDFKIICDETNNTPDVIDNNELRLSIYIQPVRTAEFILADFIATRTGINFNELTA